MAIAWWHWIAVGILLVGCELLVSGFVVIWLGLAAVLVGLVSGIFGFVYPIGTALQLFLWVIFSSLLLLLWFKVLRQKISPTKSLIGQAGNDIIGEIGLAVTDIRPFERGYVRFQWPVSGSEVWQCLAEGDITAGDRVKVIAIEGNFLKVVKTVSRS